MTFARSLTLILFSLILSGIASADQKTELNNLRQRIAAMQHEIAKTSESKSEAADALRASERAISHNNRKIAKLAQQQHDADFKLNKLQTQQRQFKKNLDLQQTLLSKLLYQQYIVGDHEYLQLILNNQDPNKVARNLHYFKYIAHDRAAHLKKLRANIQSLKKISVKIQNKSVQLTKLRGQQASLKNKLKQIKIARKKVLSQVAKQLNRQRHTVNHLKRNENRLSNLVTKISKILSEKKSNTLFHNNNLPDSRFDGKPFKQLKGKLVLPVKGDISNQFGARRPDSTVRWKGLFIKTHSGQAVKAIAAGRVVFSDWLRGFGNLLIVDHGHAYMSLYGYNETLYKQVGDEIHGGDTIATVGNSGGNPVSGLYFELRHESHPLNPMKWLAKKQLR
ncbi:MAG: peptidoglycan DD-metalloendopeptidase family protein [Gallionella sp.]